MAQDIVNWILLGCFYAAIGLGFSLVWGLMNILNLAQGSLVILGAYVAYWSYTVLHLNPFVGILVAMGVLFCIGYAIQYVMINRVIRAPFLVTFMLTFGLDLLISNVLQDVFTAGYKAINTPYSSAGFEVLGARIPLLNLAVGAIAVALTAALSLFLSRTRIGNGVKIQNNVSVYEGVELQDHVFCGPSMVFTNVKTPRSAFPRNTSADYARTLVKRGASIGANATIVCGVTVGESAFVAAGAVVTKDVPDFAMIAGVPGKQIGWACECGITLRFEASRATCSSCGRHYRKTPLMVVRDEQRR